MAHEAVMTQLADALPRLHAVMTEVRDSSVLASGRLGTVEARLLNIETLLASVPVIVQNATLAVAAASPFPIVSSTPFSVTDTAPASPIPVKVVT